MTKSALLIPHPWTPNDAVRTLAVQLRAQAPDMLDFRYSLEADMARLCVPVRGAGARADELWKHTCFEAFIAPADVAAYHDHIHLRNLAVIRGCAETRLLGSLNFGTGNANNIGTATVECFYLLSVDIEAGDLKSLLTEEQR